MVWFACSSRLGPPWAFNSTSERYNIVWSVDETYAILGVSPESFSQRLFPKKAVA
jgi:hypothetical protein